MTQTLIEILLSFLLGVLAGWLLWGRRARSEAGAPAVAAAVPVLTPGREALAAQPVAAEPAGAAADQGAAEPVTEPEPVAEPVAIAEPVAEPVAIAEPVAVAQPVAEPEPIAGPEPIAEPEPVAEPVAEPDPVAEPEPVAEPVAVAEPEPAAEPVAVPEPVAAEPELVAEPVAVVSAPEPVATPPADRSPDNLKRIEGIGPRMEAALQAAGITTFATLAGTAETELRQAIAGAGLRVSPTLPSWPQQARLLADGDEAGFRELIGRVGARSRAAKG